MFNVSRDFAPPFKMIAPYFIVGSIFYIFSIISLFFISDNISSSSAEVLSWVHLYLLGFVMMIIFGAMAQLVPVVLEVGHFSVDFFYLIWPLLFIGTAMMAYGFVKAPFLTPFGGLVVVVSMSIFLADLFLTLKKVEHFSLTVKSVIISNIFLAIGIIVGFLMSLNFAGASGAEIDKWVSAHAFLVAGGYVTLTIIGISMVLLPMFSLAHGFDEKPVTLSFYMMSGAIFLLFISVLLGSVFFKWVSIVLVFVSVIFYLKQVWIIYKGRVRKENDIWAKSLFVGYGSLATALVFGIFYLIFGYEGLLLSAGWFMFVGFFGFLIIGHLYKIVPFLVWFERFSPLVGKKRVPMLHEMIPKKAADWEFRFASVGTALSGFSLLTQTMGLFKVGVFLILISCVFFGYSMYFMLIYGKNEKVES